MNRTVYLRQVDFVDLYPQMLSSDGGPRPELFIDDRLHLNADGYKLWAEVVRAYLAKQSGLLKKS